MEAQLPVSCRRDLGSLERAFGPYDNVQDIRMKMPLKYRSFPLLIFRLRWTVKSFVHSCAGGGPAKEQPHTDPECCQRCVRPLPVPALRSRARTFHPPRPLPLPASPAPRQPQTSSSFWNLPSQACSRRTTNSGVNGVPETAAPLSPN